MSGFLQVYDTREPGGYPVSDNLTLMRAGPSGHPPSSGLRISYFRFSTVPETSIKAIPQAAMGSTGSSGISASGT